MTARSATADFDAFYRGTASRVIHVVYAATGDLGLAQDCAQEAYARAWQQWEKLRSYDEPLSWVRTVARRLAISQWRKGEAERRAFSRAHQAEPAPSHADRTVDAVAVRQALADLPPDQREVLSLFYLADQSIEQIAAELDAPTGTIKARLHRGRSALATRLRTTTRTGEEPRR
ncbi:MAG TPA: SigE family RNA polymerase sigma factor [Intrasporangiaceae bacterium]|nr:SigE family RNA polymerase sigma factor [Intrasporangiaceae bacterium]